MYASHDILQFKTTAIKLSQLLLSYKTKDCLEVITVCFQCLTCNLHPNLQHLAVPFCPQWDIPGVSDTYL